MGKLLKFSVEPKSVVFGECKEIRLETTVIEVDFERGVVLDIAVYDNYTGEVSHETEERVNYINRCLAA